MLTRMVPVGKAIEKPAATEEEYTVNAPPLGCGAFVAEVVLMLIVEEDVVVDAAGIVTKFPQSNQTPGGSVMEVIFAGTAFVSATAEPKGRVDDI